jgi:hypothetical protein
MFFRVASSHGDRLMLPIDGIAAVMRRLLNELSMPHGCRMVT